MYLYTIVYMPVNAFKVLTNIIQYIYYNVRVRMSPQYMGTDEMNIPIP